MKGQFFGGTSGLVIPIPKREFPAEQAHLSRLGYYATLENSLEVNSSFYKLPQSKTIARWAAEVPDDFRFTFKLWKQVTHQKQLLFSAADVRDFMQAIGCDSMGALLIQFPPGLQNTALLQLRELLTELSNFGWPLAVEFRHASWYNDRTYELLNSFKTALVIQDMPASATPLELTADELVYLRFHGPSGNYRDSYADSFLAEYAGYVREWLDDGKRSTLISIIPPGPLCKTSRPSKNTSGGSSTRQLSNSIPSPGSFNQWKAMPCFSKCCW